MSSVRSTGTLAASAGTVVTPTNLAPGLPGTRLNEDTLLCYTSCRSPTPTVAVPAGWTAIFDLTGTNGRMALFAKRVVGGETAPTVTWSGLTTGASGTPCLAQIACFTDLWPDLATIVDAVGTASNQAASTSAAAGGNGITTLHNHSTVLVFSTRLDDAGTWTVLGASDGVTWAKAVATGVTTSGLDMAQEWQWGDKPAAGAVAAKTFTLSPVGSSFASSGIMVALRQAYVPDRLKPRRPPPTTMIRAATR